MSLKVLIVDPDWRFARNASAFLESHAHLVVQESRPPQAVAHAKHWRPDLVIISAELIEQGLMDSLYSIKPRPAVLLTGWLKAQELHLAVVAALENAAAGTRRRRRAPASASA